MVKITPEALRTSLCKLVEIDHQARVEHLREVAKVQRLPRFFTERALQQMVGHVEYVQAMNDVGRENIGDSYQEINPKDISIKIKNY